MSLDAWKKGRGAQIHTPNKYEKIHFDKSDHDGIDEWVDAPVSTQYFHVKSQSILNEVKSDDIPFSYSANPYQGCEHGCIYCYARNTHEYWGFDAGLDFESKILIKPDAVELLKKKFNSPRWSPQTISLSGNTDCYQPIERKMKLTRQILEVCLQYKHPISIITKNALILRDLDILQELARLKLTSVMISITSTDEDLRLKLEPRTSTYKTRLNIIRQLTQAGIYTGVMNAPIIPGLNDQHMHDVLKMSADNGASAAGYTVVRLNGPIGEIFKDWLSKAYPFSYEKILNHIQSLHGGQLNDSRFKVRMKGEGNLSAIIAQQFKLFCKKFNLNQDRFEPDLTLFHRPSDNNPQLTLF